MSKVTQHKKARPKPRPRPKTPRRQKMPSLADLPNPVVVAALTGAAEQAVEDLPDRPGMRTLRELAPGSLLMIAARQAKEMGVDMTIQIEDGEPIKVRPVDIETASLALTARAMGKLTTELLAKALEKNPIKLFEAPQIKKAEPKDK
jgi:hypothetical protein